MRYVFFFAGILVLVLGGIGQTPGFLGPMNKVNSSPGLLDFEARSQIVLHVPADYSTIQEAINYAQDDDLILVAPGTYFENINLSARNITIRSDVDHLYLTKDISPLNTIIDGLQLGSVIDIHTGKTQKTTLEGFTIRNGKANQGGGIICFGNSNPIIMNNIITENMSTDVGPYGGAGIYCDMSSPRIISNTICNNTASANGGGIHCFYFSDPIILNNTIFNNFSFNGGGVCIENSSNPIITNNTIYNNSVQDIGGGIYCYEYSSPIIRNNIIWDNGALTDDELGIYWNSIPIIEYCNIREGFPGTGNIDADPLFINPLNGDFHILSNSPCIDAGYNNASGIVFYDFEGEPRIIDGDAIPGAVVDIGADEYNPSGDYNPHPAMKLIPGGEYEMGDHHDSMPKALPLHSVYIDSFFMDHYQVTNEKYATFLNSAYTQDIIEVLGGVVYKKNGGEPYCNTTSFSPVSQITWEGNLFGVVSNKNNHPMEMVSWYGAVAYANWLSATEGREPCYNLSTWDCNFDNDGYRLPTEAEWEKAARGGNYSPYYRYPWGDDLVSNIANYHESLDPYEKGDLPWTTPVGFYNGELHEKVDFNWPGSQTSYQTVNGANGWDLYDMAGNVWDWCNDWYDPDYYSTSPYDNPKGPTSGSDRQQRGGSFSESGSGDRLRTAYREYNYPPESRYRSQGFRLVLTGL